MITKILPIVLLASIFYIGSIYSSRNLGKKLEKRSQTFNDPVIDNYLKSFKTLFKSEYHLKLWGFMKDTFNDEFVEIVDGIINENN